MALAAVQGKPDKPLLRRGQQGRQNRQLDTGYGAPDTGYGAPLEEEVLDVRAGEELATYAEEPLDTYSDLNAAASDLDAKASDDENDPLAMLMKSVPGTPGEDYPIFSEAPETAFSCEGQVNGGKVGETKKSMKNCKKYLQSLLYEVVLFPKKCFLKRGINKWLYLAVEKRGKLFQIFLVLWFSQVKYVYEKRTLTSDNI